MIVSWLSVQHKSWTVLINAIKTTAFLKLIPGRARNRQERTLCVDALYEVFVAADMVAAEKSLDPWNKNNIQLFITRQFLFFHHRALVRFHVVCAKKMEKK